MRPETSAGRPPVAPVCSCGRGGKARLRIVLPPPRLRSWRRSGEKSCSRPWAACARRRGGPSAAATSLASLKRRQPRSWVAREEPSNRGSRGHSRACAPRLRRRDMPDRELERELRELGALIDYPPTPDVARSARNMLEEEASDRPRRFRMAFPRLRRAAVAAAFVLIVAVPTLSPGLRTTVSNWFAAEYFQSADEPAVDAGSSERQSEAGAPSAGVSKSGGSLAPRFSGDRISLREARARIDGALLLPRTLGKPDEVYA